MPRGGFVQEFVEMGRAPPVACVEMPVTMPAVSAAERAAVRMLAGNERGRETA